MFAGDEIWMTEFFGLPPVGQGAGVDLIDRLEAGLPMDALTKLADRVAPGDATFAFRIVPRATLARRRKARPEAPKLAAEEGAKVARLASVWALALDVWGSDDAARAFLTRPHPLLGMKNPLDVVLRSEFGGPLVEDILNGLRYGSAA